MTDKARDGDREKSGERGSRRVRDREGVTERGTETASRERQSQRERDRDSKSAGDRDSRVKQVTIFHEREICVPHIVS